MMNVILRLKEACEKLVAVGIPMSVLKRDSVFDDVIAIKYNVGNDDLSRFDEYEKRVDEFYARCVEEH
jgi:V/A-type H+-transporting ATPase subunit A